MEKQLFANKSEAERKAFVRDNCDKIVENHGYMKLLSGSQIEAVKDKLGDLSVEIEDLLEEKAQAAKMYKEALKPLVLDYKKTVQQIKQKAEFCREECYSFLDADTRKVGLYNAQGVLIEERDARPEELQTNIRQFEKKAI